MKVICKGHKYCAYRTNCVHSVSHEIITDNDWTVACSCHKCKFVPDKCVCDAVFLRKEKLIKLQNGISNL